MLMSWAASGRRTRSRRPARGRPRRRAEDRHGRQGEVIRGVLDDNGDDLVGQRGRACGPSSSSGCRGGGRRRTSSGEPRTAWARPRRWRGAEAGAAVQGLRGRRRSCPVWQTTSATIGWPWRCSGTTANGGRQAQVCHDADLVGSLLEESRRNRSTSGASSMGHAIMPATIVGPSGWSANSKLVTMPKLPPPPRSPQNRSAFSSCAGHHELAVGGDHVTRPQVVDRQAELAHEMTDASHRGSGRRRRCG